ncbi:MAG: hypothetical protein QM638_21490 [Nocardioides sp.]|uniref:plasmid mobilization protein n=1 Tax=Nocardioides sp. TaxID=35761 RepID=UPI0039E4548D
MLEFGEDDRSFMVDDNVTALCCAIYTNATQSIGDVVLMECESSWRVADAYGPCGGAGMMDPRADAKVAANYNETQDLTDFDPAESEPITIKRNVTISVRFSEEEITELRARAEQTSVKVTSFIRTAALEATRPIDRTALADLVRDLEQRAHQIVEFAASDRI